MECQTSTTRGLDWSSSVGLGPSVFGIVLTRNPESTKHIRVQLTPNRDVAQWEFFFASTDPQSVRGMTFVQLETQGWIFLVICFAVVLTVFNPKQVGEKEEGCAWRCPVLKCQNLYLSISEWMTIGKYWCCMNPFRSEPGVVVTNDAFDLDQTPGFPLGTQVSSPVTNRLMSVSMLNDLKGHWFISPWPMIPFYSL